MEATSNLFDKLNIDYDGVQLVDINYKAFSSFPKHKKCDGCGLLKGHLFTVFRKCSLSEQKYACSDCMFKVRKTIENRGK